MQQTLIDKIAEVGKPTTVVVVAGGAIAMPANTNVSSTIYALYPGVETGTAFANVYFGAVSPAGRFPFSVPKSVEQLPLYTNFSMVAKPFGRTFAWMKGKGSQQLFEYVGT